MTESEVVADYDVRSPASRTLLTVVGTILFVTLVGGLVLGASILARDTKLFTTVLEAGDSALVVIDAGEADIRVVQGEADVVRIQARITSGLRKTDFEIGRRGNEIKILSGCQAWLNPGCGVDTTVEVPEGLPVEIRTTSGDVVAESIVKGVLTVRTGAGNVVARALKVDEFSATTSSGDVSADFTKQPFGFKATTGSGDVSATIPAGKRTYAVSATSSSGDVSSTIESDDEGAGFVSVITKSGDVDLTTR